MTCVPVVSTTGVLPMLAAFKLNLILQPNNICNVTGILCSGANANNVKYMSTTACDHTVDCRDLIRGKYTEIIISYLHVN